MLNYKKPAFWAVTAVVIAMAAAAVCLLTNPVKKDSYPKKFDGIGIEALSTGSDREDIVIDAVDFKNKDGNISIKIKWRNNSIKTILYGEPFKVLIKNNEGLWEELSTDVSWNLPAYLVTPKSSSEKEYEISSSYDLSREGIYRFMTYCFFENDPSEQYYVWVDFSFKDNSKGMKTVLIDKYAQLLGLKMSEVFDTIPEQPESYYNGGGVTAYDEEEGIYLCFDEKFDADSRVSHISCKVSTVFADRESLDYEQLKELFGDALVINPIEEGTAKDVWVNMGKYRLCFGSYSSDEPIKTSVIMIAPPLTE